MTRQQIIDSLYKARAALLDSGYCGPGDHGLGDDEVNAIDAVLEAYTLDAPLPGAR